MLQLRSAADFKFCQLHSKFCFKKKRSLYINESNFIRLCYNDIDILFFSVIRRPASHTRPASLITLYAHFICVKKKTVTYLRVSLRQLVCVLWFVILICEARREKNKRVLLGRLSFVCFPQCLLQTTVVSSSIIPSTFTDILYISHTGTVWQMKMLTRLVLFCLWCCHLSGKLQTFYNLRQQMY